MHVSVVGKPLAQRDADIADGNYDMVIDSGPAPSSTPWTYFDSVYRLPLQRHQQAGFNDERYSDPAAWALVEQAAATPPSRDQGGGQDLRPARGRLPPGAARDPAVVQRGLVPGQHRYWQGYPSSTSPDDEYTPVMWAGWLGSMTTVYALAQLKPR